MQSVISQNKSVNTLIKWQYKILSINVGITISGTMLILLNKLIGR